MKKNYCIENLLRYINLLQINSSNKCKNSLNSSISYNTRVISLYKKDGSLFIFNNSYLFRIMDMDDNKITLLLLNNDYSSTNQYVTVDISCIYCVRCLEDIFVNI